ncbi:MAG: hypothetical protein BWY31_04159 [Lentisphaerae bacterium ADurb.Bin242]|nr:MAG: hypothetical protein BWY31_04159 [Lentisphaerae bacterium ADurb.Bin242]
MTDLKKQLLTEPIKRYTVRCVAKAGPEPEQLMGEMELCGKFKVGRGTVRRAMASLIAGGYVILLPKRRGYFTNPEFSEQTPFRIGILVASGFASSMAYISAEAFCGIAESMHGFFCTYDFLTLSSDDPETVVAEIGNAAVDGLLWISPEESFVEAIDRLLAENFPVVSIENVYLPLRRKPRYNFYAYDYFFAGECRAKYFLREKCRRIIYCTENADSVKQFAKTLHRGNVPFDGNSVFTSAEEIMSRLPELLNRNRVDGIVCDGPTLRYNALFKTLSAHPDGSAVKVLVEHEPQAILMAKHFPHLKIAEIPEVDMLKTSYRMGRKVGTLLKDIITKKKNFFNPPEMVR